MKLSFSTKHAIIYSITRFVLVEIAAKEIQSMLPGVYIAKKKDGTIYYRSSFTYQNKHISLGSYPTEEKAHLAYCTAISITNDNSSIEDSYYLTYILPFEKIVSDTTTIGFKGKPYDWTFYLDVFNNEIVGYDVRDSMCGNGVVNHKEALNDMLNNKIKRGYKDLETIVHTDQGIIYSSVSFNNIFNSYKVIRSMSRAGTPTDNPVIESKNGWIKKEMYIDFDINNYNTVQEFIDDIVWDNNNYRPSYALQYKTPIEYRTQLGFK